MEANALECRNCGASNPAGSRGGCLLCLYCGSPLAGEHEKEGTHTTVSGPKTLADEEIERLRKAKRFAQVRHHFKTDDYARMALELQEDAADYAVKLQELQEAEDLKQKEELEREQTEKKAMYGFIKMIAGMICLGVAGYRNFCHLDANVSVVFLIGGIVPLFIGLWEFMKYQRF